MNNKVIKKGRKAICHLPIFLKRKTVYTQTIRITDSMFKVTDSCRPGFSKLWGISLGHIHWNNSYRFTFMNRNGKLELYYYCYINGISPQDNHTLKGKFDINIEIASELSLSIEFKDSCVKMAIYDFINNQYKVVNVPLPIGLKYPITECYPNLKCKQEQDTHFKVN